MAARSFAAQGVQPYPQLAQPEPGGNLSGLRRAKFEKSGVILRGPGKQVQNSLRKHTRPMSAAEALSFADGVRRRRRD
jgi:hypothetical protein